jgi:tRNA U34 5-methylaminomethyl-2-thiouridine-forming methyltransferase MnmC
VAGFIGFIFVCLAGFVVNEFAVSNDYQLVQLANGEKTLFSASYGEKMHPGLGPQAEAELLYVRQLNICERLRTAEGEFIIWDVGLGAAANAIATLRATRDISGKLRLVSFDNTREPLEFALQNAAALNFPAGYDSQLATLLHTSRVEFANGKLAVEWEFQLGDFPALLANAKFPPPHAIFYDAFSPAKNPAMWTRPVFENLFCALDPQRPCALTTYSRSTLLRTTLLLAGFFVGAGHATGMKEETTVAANTLELIAEPLGQRWLERALRSDSAEPLREPTYTRAPLSPDTAAKLRRHPQF